MSFYDAHNHLQDDRFGGRQEELIRTCRGAGIARMVVNGSCESDWPAVLKLARLYPEVLPSFGYHPWYVAERTANWRDVLIQFLDQVPSGVGEVGLDRWKAGLDPATQEEVFRWQLGLAAERNLPISIHCLKAWGHLHELLRTGPRPAVGFLLHSYGGPREMISPLANLGAYFSLPGYFARDRKERQRETFRHVPIDRLLLETDAPDQPLPSHRNQYPWSDAGPELNHPANLVSVYRFAAELLEKPADELSRQVEANFSRLFGSIRPMAAPPP